MIVSMSGFEAGPGQGPVVLQRLLALPRPERPTAGYARAKHPRDTQRGKLYRAENECFGRDWPKMDSLEETEAYARWVMRSAWWRKRHPRVREQSITFGDGRGARRAVAYGVSRVIFPKWSRQQWVVLHELAHLAINARFGWRKVPGHGREFATEYLALVRRFLGADWAHNLREHFKENHVHWRGGRKA